MVDYKTSLTNGAGELYDKITRDLSLQQLKKYGKEEWSLETLDNWRSTNFPNELKKRHANGELHITKDELALLMDWKLAKGKFRPALPKLIQDNQEEKVKTTTESGLTIFTDYASKFANWLDVDMANYEAALRLALKKLSELRGVGPATASLLLSLLKEITPLAPPFFSDEAFLYFVQDPLRPGLPIKYNVKEYVNDYVPIAIGIARKYSIASLDLLERGAWALKMYDMYRSNKLADIELPKDIDADALAKFEDAADFVVEPAKPAKRSASATPKAVKKSKKV